MDGTEQHGRRQVQARRLGVVVLLDSTWERDWPGTIALLDGFLAQWPTYAVAQDKLYAALLADAEANLQAQQMGAGVAELERAARLLPERGEAWARLAQLVTAAQSDRT